MATQNHYKYLTYAEFAEKSPGIPQEFYEAVLSGKYLVRLNGKDLFLCDDQAALGFRIGDNKKFEVWSGFSLLREKRALPLKT